MTTPTALIVIGAGGFGPEIVWAAQNTNGVEPTFRLVGFCDDAPDKAGGELAGLPILGSPEDAARRLPDVPGFVCAIGNNKSRAAVVRRALALGWRPLTVIDPSVIVGPRVIVGLGTYVGAGSILSPNARLGNHVIINHHCSVGHDSVLDDFVQVSPGGRVSGGCHLEEGATLGSNAVVAPRCRVGKYATVGAASFALRDVAPRTTVIGTPARVAARQDGESGR
jgi:sugar O-acyltransferase (sialic acid O-acetyltransferase NeuD family)